MKTLNTYINEWKASSNTLSSIEKKDIKLFIYEPKITCNIKVFDPNWPLFEHYKNKVYMNGKKIPINHNGFTIDIFDKGRYEFYIEDINDITNCQYMFGNCSDLVKVPKFDTSKVEYMDGMFYSCANLEEVPLLDTSKVESMVQMFYKCKSLNEQTKQIWSKMYDFKIHHKK